jgi:hypothetical protein
MLLARMLHEIAKCIYYILHKCAVGFVSDKISFQVHYPKSPLSGGIYFYFQEGEMEKKKKSLHTLVGFS